MIPPSPPAVWLFNFGGPQSASEVEPFLERLFSDPFILRSPYLPHWLRQCLARRIARKRAPQSVLEYQKIGFSPLNEHTAAQGKHLHSLITQRDPDAVVQVVNRYTPPFANEAWQSCDPRKYRNFFISLYPHLCHSTVVSSFWEFDQQYRKSHGGNIDFTSTRIFSWWHHQPYTRWCVDQILSALPQLPDQPITVLFSAHGLPRKFERRGDPYVEEVKAHMSQIILQVERRRQKTNPLTWHLSFQSRVGPTEWTRPYTDEVIEEAGRRGGLLILVPISFTADHIETLFEMDVTYQELAIRSGFQEYKRTVPPNSQPILAQFLYAILTEYGL